jgi:hypothetical protein
MKITKVYTDLLAQGFKQADIDALDTKTSDRDFFQEEVKYSKDDTHRWAAEKVGLILEEEGKATKRILTWAVCYQAKNGEDWVTMGTISKSMLLKNSIYDNNGKMVVSRGSIRAWATTHMVGRYLDKEVMSELAKELNTRGYVVVKDVYTHPKFTENPSRFKQPFFADDFDAEKTKAIDYTAKPSAE